MHFLIFRNGKNTPGKLAKCRLEPIIKYLCTPLQYSKKSHLVTVTGQYLVAGRGFSEQLINGKKERKGRWGTQKSGKVININDNYMKQKKRQAQLNIKDHNLWWMQDVTHLLDLTNFPSRREVESLKPWNKGNVVTVRRMALDGWMDERADDKRWRERREKLSC